MSMKHIFKKRKALMFSVLILIVFFMSFSFVLAAGSSFSYFGGNITTVVQCTCSPGSQVTIANTGHNAMFNGTYLYSPATIKMTGKGIPGGTQILGLYSPGGVCQMIAYPKCTDLQISRGTMKIIGTN